MYRQILLVCLKTIEKCFVALQKKTYKQTNEQIKDNKNKNSTEQTQCLCIWFSWFLFSFLHTFHYFAIRSNLQEKESRKIWRCVYNSDGIQIKERKKWPISWTDQKMSFTNCMHTCVQLFGQCFFCVCCAYVFLRQDNS